MNTTTDTAPPKACCLGLEVDPLDGDRALDLAAAHKALGDPHRQALLHVLSAAGEAVCVCDLEQHLPLSQPTVSHHLKILTEAGLLSREKQGRWAYYTIRRDRVADLVGALEGWKT